ncbi:hypothetical protein E4K63_00630 [Allofrancisella inopinata]|uniref:Uncharacterized protein n=1 Tax=Allofrancisella inopinata TaxID=1085647 RepID=A0AAE6YGM7_9GAMM|nr:hypothetical protein [Allofrancisella inopinata]QIV95420.1 hypothetical protein E4K63_00630 [Allofrancisella inopinata]
MLVLTSAGGACIDTIGNLRCTQYSCVRQGGKETRQVRRYEGNIDGKTVDVGIFKYNTIEFIFKWEREFNIKRLIDFSGLKGITISAHGTQAGDYLPGGHVDPFSPPPGSWDIFFSQPYGSILNAPDSYERLKERVFGKWSRDSEGKNSCVMYMGCNKELELNSLRENKKITYSGDKVQKNLQKFVTGTATFDDKIMNASLSPWISSDLKKDEQERRYSIAFTQVQYALGLGVVHIFKENRSILWVEMPKLSDVLMFISKYNLPRRVELSFCRGLKGCDVFGLFGQYNEAVWKIQNNEGYSITQALQLHDSQGNANNIKRIHESYNVNRVSLATFNKNIKRVQIQNENKPQIIEQLKNFVNNIGDMANVFMKNKMKSQNSKGEELIDFREIPFIVEDISRSSTNMKNLEDFENPFSSEDEIKQQQQMYQKDRSLSPPPRNAITPQQQQQKGFINTQRGFYNETNRSLSPPPRNAITPQQQQQKGFVNTQRGFYNETNRSLSPPPRNAITPQQQQQKGFVTTRDGRFIMPQQQMQQRGMDDRSLSPPQRNGFCRKLVD